MFASNISPAQAQCNKKKYLLLSLFPDFACPQFRILSMQFFFPLKPSPSPSRAQIKAFFLQDFCARQTFNIRPLEKYFISLKTAQYLACRLIVNAQFEIRKSYKKTPNFSNPAMFLSGLYMGILYSVKQQGNILLYEGPVKKFFSHNAKIAALKLNYLDFILQSSIA